MIDRVEISVIEEPQPRWLSFLNDEQDVVDRIPDEFCESAMPNNKLAPHLARRGIQMVRYQRNDVSLSYFAMENPVVGGYTPDKVALRRAISLAVDVEREIRIARRGQAIPAQSHIPPPVWGYDPAFKSEMSDFDRAKARALLDLYGYVDRDGDGWREQPDGSPLTIEYATSPDAAFRVLYEQWHINMNAIGIRIVPLIRQWPEHLKASRAGKLMMWGVGWSGGPDGEEFLALGYGPNKGQANHARFDLPAYNALFERQRVLPDGPERAAVIDEAKRLMVAYMPYKVHVHRIWTDLSQPWVIGYHRNVFVREFWKYVDVDMDERARKDQAVSTTDPAGACCKAPRRLPGRSARGCRRLADERKVLRLLFSSAETSFDPARISDLYSRAVTAHIFEAPYAYDALARPARACRSLAALGMPEVSDDFRVWTVRLQPGIYFADDPAFKGQRRELVAQDYVYAFQRAVDPANISPIELKRSSN